MRRYDLRKHKENFYERMETIITKELDEGEVAIFLFEVGDFTPVQKSADLVKKMGHTLMNSLRFNEVDWSMVVRKEKNSLQADMSEKKESN